MWKDWVKVKAFLNVKNEILSKGSVEARNLLLLLLLLLLFKIWTSECRLSSKQVREPLVVSANVVKLYASGVVAFCL
jgi:hypothetical protein